jgi:hypothetical protein
MLIVSKEALGVTVVDAAVFFLVFDLTLDSDDIDSIEALVEILFCFS